MGPSTARDYAARLLRPLGAEQTLPPGGAEHPGRRWGESGLMALTGHADGPAQMFPAPLAACADGVGLALAALAPDSGIERLARAERLSERAAIAGFTRNGTVAPGGSCRLLDTADGRIAVNLARPEDWELVPAWLELEGEQDWSTVAAAVAEYGTEALESNARLLGLPVAAVVPPPPAAPPWFRVTEQGPARTPEGPPLVVDLSSLWAGPLCTHVLGALGARVIKVESHARPDGARRGPAAFYDLLNAGKESVALDLHSSEGVSALQALLERADIVVESARPRGLRQLGVDAEALVRSRPGLTWLSITGYGREQPTADWVGFGDDASVAAGLAQVMEAATGEALMVGDAIADPLTGLHAALAAWATYQAGGGRLLSLALRDVTAHCLRFDLPASDMARQQRQNEWTRPIRAAACELPAARAPGRSAADLGADTDAVLGQLVSA